MSPPVTFQSLRFAFYRYFGNVGNHDPYAKILSCPFWFHCSVLGRWWLRRLCHFEFGDLVVSHFGETSMEPTGLVVRSGVDHALHYDGGGHVVGVENRSDMGTD